MIYQILIGQDLVDGVPGGRYEVPFYGRYSVSLVKIDYVYNTAATVAQSILRIESNTLLSNTPLQGGFMFSNVANPFYNGLVINNDIEINGFLDIRLPRVIGNGLYPNIGGAGGYINCVITLDFKKVVVDQSMVGFSNNKPLFNF
jgi:hypothetical protein